MNKFLHKVVMAVRHSKSPRLTMVGMILKLHGWKQDSWWKKTASWYPPGERIFC